MVESRPLRTLRLKSLIKQVRLTGELQDDYASPIGADGRVYIAPGHAKVILPRAAGHWEVLAINEFESYILGKPLVRADSDDVNWRFRRDVNNSEPERR